MSTIVVGTDHSPQARSAVATAAEMARLHDASLHIVTAVPYPQVADLGVVVDYSLFDTSEAAQRSLDEMADEFSATLKVTTAVLRTDPVTALCDEATRLGASVIVVGNKRVQGLARVLGSVAGGVARSAPCDVHIAHTYG